MSCRSLFSLALVLMLAGCASEAEKQKKEVAEKLKDRKEHQEKQVADPAFVAFLGRLRAAVAKKDLPTLSSMMTADFGYRWDTPPVGDNIFTYWDLNDTWPVLSKILHEPFVPHEDYLISPPAAATDPSYRGYRAGIRQVRGSWKFAYFVPGEGVAAQ
jgi:hypothetical protein